MKKRIIKWGIGCGLIFFVAFCASTITLSTIIDDYSQEDNTEPADTIIVLGAGSRRVLERRTAHAAELYDQGIADSIICTGGDTEYSERAESEYCRQILLAYDIPAEDIYIETESRSTEENAIHAQDIIEMNNWTSAVIVSDDYHLWRAQLIFTSELGEGFRISTSPAQLTQSPVPSRFRDNAIRREVFATYWFIGKEFLGLPYTDFPPG